MADKASWNDLSKSWNDRIAEYANHLAKRLDVLEKEVQELKCQSSTPKRVRDLAGNAPLEKPE